MRSRLLLFFAPARVVGPHQQSADALVGDPKRIALVASDLVAHWERRCEAMQGKAMIVCMSRRICVALYDAIIALRPAWAEETLKVVMTGSADDGPAWQKHIGNKTQRRELARPIPRRSARAEA